MTGCLYLTFLRLTMCPMIDIPSLLKIKYPIIQAPMAGGTTTPELVAAVSNAGALGSLGAGYMSANEIRRAIHSIRKLTHQPFAVNLFIPEKYQATETQIYHMQHLIAKLCPELAMHIAAPTPPYAPDFDEQVQVILAENVPIFSFTFGVLSNDWISQFKKNGILLIGTATHVEEGRVLDRNGIDVIVAQGSEAGGHRGTFIGKAEHSLIGVAELISQCVACVKTPIVAAGGIMNAKHMTAMFDLGASGVQMGSAFLTCPESGIHPKFKEKILAMQSDDTLLTRAFSGKLARGIENKFIRRMQAHEKEILDYPIQNALTRTMRKAAEQQNDLDFMSMWAGQHAYLSKGLPVREFIDELVRCLSSK